MKRVQIRRYVFIGVITLYALRCTLHAAEFPRGFFVEDLRSSTPLPAFYNLDTHALDAFTFRQSYASFIDIAWDREPGRVFFSAKQKPTDPYRVYLKSWPNGEEKIIYENPLGPFRFILSPDGGALVIQVMGPASWPILAVHDWVKNQSTLLGEGFSPDWSPDGQRVLFLQISNHSLPAWLAEYRVDTATTTRILDEPVAEAVYADTPDLIVLKTAKQSTRCDEYQVWNRRKDSRGPFSAGDRPVRMKGCLSQREITAFPGHQFLFFKESRSAADVSEQTLVILDPSGGRMQTIARDVWDPKATAVESMTLAIGEDPMYVMSGDGTGQRQEIPRVRFVRIKR